MFLSWFNQILQQFLRSGSVLLCTYLLVCVPGEDDHNHIQCSSNYSNCSITNSYGIFPDRSICRAAEVSYPKTEQELISIVASATRNRRKMKVATRFSHSITKLVCPEGQDGLLISTKYLNHTLSIDTAAMTMTVESGVTLRQLINEAAEAGLALPYTPYWWGITVGGMIGTGAHGSSLWWKGSSVHEYIVELRIVSPAGPEDGYVKVRTLKEGDGDLDAAKLSLGVLGAISQITLKLEPLFKRSITYVSKDDSDLGDEVVDFGHRHEFADITWYPSQFKAVYRIDDRVPFNTTGNGLYDFTGFRPILSVGLALQRSAEDILEYVSNAEGKCLLAKAISNRLLSDAYGLTNDGNSFKAYPVIGFQNRLQSSGTCLDSVEQNSRMRGCAWDPRLKGTFFHQTTFSIGLSKVKDFIKDVQKLVAIAPRSLCGVELYNGILMRYVKATSAHLGTQEDAVDFDITYYRSKDMMTPRLYEDILEEIEQIGLFKYGGLPHWGKNRNIAFDGVVKKYRNADKFLKVKKVYDSLGLFSSEWTDQILGLKEGLAIYKEGCALEGLCICSQDIHCAPSRGYYCRPGKVYAAARVCTRLCSKEVESSNLISQN